MNIDLERHVKNHRLVDGAPLLECETLSKVFFDGPVQRHVHVLVQSRVGLRKHPLDGAEEGIFSRFKRSKLATTAPSETAIPSTFELLQHSPSEKILDDRPEPETDIPPIPLLYDGFGYFLDVMDGHDNVPGLADIDAPKLRNAVDELALEMTKYFGHEDVRRDRSIPYLNRIFAARRGNKIVIPELSAAAIGSITSDGHNIAFHGTGSSAVTIKNSVAGISSLPLVELIGYVARLHTKMDERLYLGWRVPCLGLTIVGCDITFYAVIAIDHHLRVVPLTPTFSCIGTASDGRDRAHLYSAFTAASVLQAHILEDATRFTQSFPPAIPIHARRFPAIQRFFPERLPNRLLFIETTSGPDEQQVVIKFARKYSIELHGLCSSLGHAPQLLAFELLPGGWCGVAMSYVQNAVPITLSPLLLKNRQRWRDELQTLVKHFHEQGFLHGDLRSPNIVCEGESVLLLDFDWGGRAGEVSYPTWKLNNELLVGRVSEDLKITQDDDRRVLANTLNALG